MKRIYYLALIFCFTGSILSCKKEDNSVMLNVNEQLPETYIVIESNTGHFYTIYFVNENNTMNAYLDGYFIRRVLEVNVSDNADSLILPFYDGNYTFKLIFTRTGNNKITINNIYCTNLPGFIAHAEIYKTAEAPVFLKSNGTNTIYRFTKPSNSTDMFLYFNAFAPSTAWKYDGGGYAPSAFFPIYVIGNNIGWKSNAGDIFGISVNTWKNNHLATMLFDSANNVTDIGKHVAILY